MRFFLALLLAIAAGACGRNSEREISPVEVPNALATVGEGRFASAAGEAVTIAKTQEGWSLTLELPETLIFKMTVTIDPAIQRANLKIEFPDSERYGRPVEPAVLRSSLPPEQLGIFGRPGATSFEIHCDYGGQGGISGVAYLPAVPKGTKAKYDYRLSALKDAIPEINYLILTNGMQYETRAMAPGAPLGEDYANLADTTLKAELGSVLRNACAGYAPTMNYVGYTYGIALESLSASELRIVSSHSRSWSSPVFNKTERERSFRRVR